jgi:7-carboxy-7-deazaguanine synthase
MASLWLTRDADCRRFEGWLADDRPTDDWHWGYLGGMIDAEGSLSARLLRVAQSHTVNPATSRRLRRTLDRLAVPYTVEPSGFYLHRSGGGLWRVLANARPAKGSVRKAALRSHPRHHRVIESVEPTGVVEPVVTLSTSAGSYIAAGYVVKNCDTAHAFRHGTRMTRRAVFEQVLAFDCPLVELTGGEPLEQPETLVLMRELCDAGRTVLIETSGAHDIGGIDPRVHVILDLKCPDSGESHRNHWPNLDRLKPSDQIKFVVASRRDWDWAVATVREHALDRRFQVLVSTAFAGVTPRELADWLLQSGLNLRLQLQLHKYIWEPTARGV